MTDAQKRGFLIIIVVVALAAAAYSIYTSMAGPKVEVVGTMPQLSKAEEQAAAQAAEEGRRSIPTNDAVRTGTDPADMEAPPKGKG